MSAASQLILDLPVRPALGREDFFVAESNATAVAWIDRWPDWPARVAVLVGPPGCGKSHLAQVWRGTSDAVALAPKALGEEATRDLLGDATCCLLDDAEAVAGMVPGVAGKGAAQESSAAEQGLFHLFNLVIERQGFLLMAARQAPARWHLGLADLASRLKTAQILELGAPDDSLMAALFAKLFADRQLRPGKGVIAYLVAHAERSHAAARQLVAEIDRRALGERGGATLPLVRRLLAEQTGSGAEAR